MTCSESITTQILLPPHTHPPYSRVVSAAEWPSLWPEINKIIQYMYRSRNTVIIAPLLPLASTLRRDEILLQINFRFENLRRGPAAARRSCGGGGGQGLLASRRPVTSKAASLRNPSHINSLFEGVYIYPPCNFVASSHLWPYEAGGGAHARLPCSGRGWALCRGADGRVSCPAGGPSPPVQLVPAPPAGAFV